MEDFKKTPWSLWIPWGFLKKSALGFGSIALSSLLGP